MKTTKFQCAIATSVLLIVAGSVSARDEHKGHQGGPARQGGGHNHGAGNSHHVAKPAPQQHAPAHNHGGGNRLQQHGGNAQHHQNHQPSVHSNHRPSPAAGHQPNHQHGQNHNQQHGQVNSVSNQNKGQQPGAHGHNHQPRNPGNQNPGHQNHGQRPGGTAPAAGRGPNNPPQGNPPGHHANHPGHQFPGRNPSPTSPVKPPQHGNHGHQGNHLPSHNSNTAHNGPHSPHLPPQMNHGHHGGGPRTGPTTVHLPQQGHHNNHHNHSHFPNSVVVGQRQINLASTGYRPTYYRHGTHYHGHWHGAGNPAPNGGYGWAHNHHHHHPYRPYFWGLGGWGLGTLVYTSGYSGYYNPYCLTASGPTVVYNYTQPIPVVYNASVASDQNSISPASQILDSAVVVFKQNQYDTALDIINQGVRQHPDDAVLHEFRALVLFAKGDYQQAASTIHSVLAIGPGWDWSTLSGLYADVNIYTAQLRSLEGFVKQNPQDGASRFLLAYHYMSDGYPDAATRQLQQVTALVPNDAVAAAMLKMTSAQAGTVANDPTPIPVPEPPLALPALSQRPAVPEIDATAMVGTWTAVREDGSQFTLTLTGEKTFRWSYQANNQPEQTFDGTYTYEENVLALERNGGGSLVADIKSADGAQFNFKMVGAPNEDPGLNFTK